MFNIWKVAEQIDRLFVYTTTTNSYHKYVPACHWNIYEILMKKFSQQKFPRCRVPFKNFDHNSQLRKAELSKVMNVELFINIYAKISNYSS